MKKKNLPGMSFDLLRMVVPFWFWLLLLLLLLASCFLLFVSVNGMDIVEVLFDLVLILCHQVFSRHPHQSQTIVQRFDSCCGFLPVVPRRQLRKTKIQVSVCTITGHWSHTVLYCTSVPLFPLRDESLTTQWIRLTICSGRLRTSSVRNDDWILTRRAEMIGTPSSQTSFIMQHAHANTCHLPAMGPLWI